MKPRKHTLPGFLFSYVSTIYDKEFNAMTKIKFSLRKAQTKYPSIGYVKELLEYFPETDLILWKTNYRTSKAGEEAGFISRQGYRVVNIGSAHITTARLAWALSYGEWPTRNVKYMNLNRQDVRIANLYLPNSDIKPSVNVKSLSRNNQVIVTLGPFKDLDAAKQYFRELGSK